MTTEYCWSYTEDGPFTGEADSREQAAVCALNDYPDDDVVYTGRAIRPELAELVHVDRWLEIMEEGAYEWVGDWQDGEAAWPDLTGEQQAELKTELVGLLEGFLAKHNAMPTFARVVDVRNIAAWMTARSRHKKTPSVSS